MIGVHGSCPNVPENVAEAVAFHSHLVSGEVTGLRVVERIAANSLKNYSLSILGEEHDGLMLAARATPRELALDPASELLESAFLLRHVPSMAPAPWTPFSSKQEPGSAPRCPEGLSEW